MKCLCGLVFAVAAFVSSHATTVHGDPAPEGSSSSLVAPESATLATVDDDAAAGTCTACGQRCIGGFCNLSLRCVPFATICDL